MEIAPGTEIAGRYVVERKLARGGMGPVYVARDSKFDRTVALKIAAASGVTHDVFRARFEREARSGHLLGQESGFVRAVDLNRPSAPERVVVEE